MRQSMWNVVGILLILLLGLLFLRGKSDVDVRGRTDRVMQYVHKVDSLNGVLRRENAIRDSVILELRRMNAVVLTRVHSLDNGIKVLDRVYEDRINNIKRLGIDSNVRLLSEWLSREDSIR